MSFDYKEIIKKINTHGPKHKLICENIRRFNQNESDQPGTSRCRYISPQNGFRCIGIYPSQSLDDNGFCEKHNEIVQLGAPGNDQNEKQCLSGNVAKRVQIGIFGSSTGPSFHNRRPCFRHVSLNRCSGSVPLNRSAQHLGPYARPSDLSCSAHSTILCRKTDFGQSLPRTAERFGVSPVPFNNFEDKQQKSEPENEELLPEVTTAIRFIFDVSTKEH
uniref:Uncharacterized protein n=1 Tax=Ditylenchus dipsaci TaxID=166011 RepID=A0A915CVL0_9BILA